MQKVRSWFSRLPIKWKMVLWSSCMLFLLFAAYNFAQYIAMNRWMVLQEQTSIQRNMAELQDYFQEKRDTLNVRTIEGSRGFLEKVNGKRQLIRILDEQGKPIVTVSDGLPPANVIPQTALQTELLSVWHYEDHLLVMRSPLIAGSFHGTIEIVHNLETFDQLSDSILWIMIVAGAGAILLSAIGGLMIARQLLRPIHSLTNAIRNVKKRGLHERVEYRGASDELSRLASLFNDLMHQLEFSFQQQKQFVEDASHELRTPIAIIKGHLSLLDRWGKRDPEMLDQSLSVTLQEFSRLEKLVQELLTLTRAENEAPALNDEAVRPADIVKQTADRFAALHPSLDIAYELGPIESDTFIRVVPRHLEQTLLILLDNAVKYAVDVPVIRITGKRTEERAEIRVIDRGIGIPPEELPFIFDRFYRVDKARSREKGGTGLGLAIAKRLVEKNGGQITITSSEQEGTCVLLSFPLEGPMPT
ncbi:HAMP domain-containing histidine kinase [Paenibacillus filicis]|uniref:Signal transduction histidine-protein kinase ArlS n=1 Tax=Paenibacillus gyeongsangnamensis TaxID=3388067 RepID=A0ABT4Q5U6_9BACL|nr:HAMP domain-containing histidine kinase [Paenibacillus filicis]MCZ8512235.1 HAMP domain-containing histidine kinase [Paenibacillus filicis]